MRGPAFGDTSLAPDHVPARRTRAEHFDRVALRVFRLLLEHWSGELGDVELAVEEVPVLPAQWSAATVPLSSYVEATAGRQPRIVLFRRPLEHRADGLPELETLLLTVLAEQVAEVLGLRVEDVLPGYDED